MFRIAKRMELVVAVRKSISPAVKPKLFKLQDWYASEGAKRSFGRICQAVNEEGASVTLLGSEDSPLLVLADAEDHPASPDEIILTIDEAKADWAAVTTAAAIYGTKFRIKGKKVMRATLRRHPEARHPAERYLRSQSEDANALAQRIEELAKEIRRLGQQMKRNLFDQRNGVIERAAERLASSADIIDRRFREIWRLSNGYSSMGAA